MILVVEAIALRALALFDWRMRSESASMRIEALAVTAGALTAAVVVVLPVVGVTVGGGVTAVAVVRAVVDVAGVAAGLVIRPVVDVAVGVTSSLVAVGVAPAETGRASMLQMNTKAAARTRAGGGRHSVRRLPRTWRLLLVALLSVFVLILSITS
ncbi:MAG: hypothetical protein ACOX8V_02095 [Thermoleophilia bacterium]